MLGTIRQTREVSIFRPALRALGPSPIEGASGREQGAESAQLAQRLPGRAEFLPSRIKRHSTLARKARPVGHLASAVLYTPR